VTITIKDIARIAGVSHSTVSRSLNNSPLVSEITKERIKEIALNTGFQFNASARSLSTNKTGTIGVIYPESFGEFGRSLYYNSLLTQLRDSLEKMEMDEIVAFPKNRITKESNIRRLITSRKIDGLIIIHPNINDVDEKIIHFINMSRIPCVFLHHSPTLQEVGKMDVICTDHFTGGYNATEHFIKLGHKKILCITSHGESKEFIERTAGYKAALNDHGIEFDKDLIFCGYRDITSGYNIVKSNLKFININKITAIFAQTDLMAIGAVQALKEEGIKVPEDISVIGYDDIELALSFKPALTTIHQPREEIALLGCERLVELISGKKVKRKINLVLQTNLVERESTKSIK
jgi:LacI family transcriptional regulator